MGMSLDVYMGYAVDAGNDDDGGGEADSLRAHFRDSGLDMYDLIKEYELLELYYAGVADYTSPVLAVRDTVVSSYYTPTDALIKRPSDEAKKQLREFAKRFELTEPRHLLWACYW